MSFFHVLFRNLVFALRAAMAPVRFISSSILLASLLLPLQAGGAAAERRVALVIGNSSYLNAPRLPNPANDAVAVQKKLKRLGFDVVAGIDVNRRGFAKALKRFARKAASADVALFFYAGHGLQINGQNYLLPTDARLNRADALRGEMVTLNRVLKIMEVRAKTKLVFLDACRNNPLSRTLKQTLKTRAARLSGLSARSLARGLAQVRDAAGGTFIAFATAPGMTAADGNGRHSPFTTALLQHIDSRGLEVNELLRRVRVDVEKLAGRMNFKQTPWGQSSLRQKFYFKPGLLGGDIDTPSLMIGVGIGGL